MPCTVWCGRAPFNVRESYSDVLRRFDDEASFIPLTLRDGSTVVVAKRHITSMTPTSSPREEKR